MDEACWEDDRSRGPLRWPARPRSRSGGCAAAGIGARTGAMIAGTGAMTAGTGVGASARPFAVAQAAAPITESSLEPRPRLGKVAGRAAPLRAASRRKEHAEHDLFPDDGVGGRAVGGDVGLIGERVGGAADDGERRADKRSTCFTDDARTARIEAALAQCAWMQIESAARRCDAPGRCHAEDVACRLPAAGAQAGVAA